MLPVVCRREGSRVRREAWVLLAVALMVCAVPTLCARGVWAQVGPTSSAGQTAAAADDVRLSDLERQVAQIRDELIALRKGNESASRQEADRDDDSQDERDWEDETGDDRDDESVEYEDTAETGEHDSAVNEEDEGDDDAEEEDDDDADKDDADDDDRDADDFELTYARAQALAAFVLEHVKAEGVEARVEGDKLIVTATYGLDDDIADLVEVASQLQKRAIRGAESQDESDDEDEGEAEVHEIDDPDDD